MSTQRSVFKSFLLSALGAAILLGAGASASAFTITFENGTQTTLRKIVKESQATCPNLHCVDVALTVRSPEAREMSTLPTELRASLIKRAKEFAAAQWPDTVLEGPYETNFRFRTDAIEFLELENKVVGFRVTVSAPAWEIEKCAYNPDDKSTLKGCPHGRILESQFIAKDLSDLFADENALAAYIPNEP